MKRKEKGITLIALVVTIIVLLILAGISIAMLTGSNGVLDKTAEAAEKTDEAEVKERVQLEYLASYDTDGKFNLEIFKEKLNENLQVHPDDMKEEPEGGLTFECMGYDVVVTKNGEVTVDGDGVPTVKEDIDPSSKDIVGKTVKYTTKNISEWYPYFSDGTNIYLIATNYIENSKMNSSLNKTNNGNYKIYWASLPSIYPSNVNNDIKNKWYTCSNTSYNNSRPAAALLEKNYWEDYAGEHGMAIGSPTLEMFREAWNKRYTSNTIGSLSNSVYGYNNTLTVATEGRTDPTFVIQDTSNASWYWLASPYNYNNSNQDYFYYMNNGGSLSYTQYSNSTGGGLRPVVRLDSTIKLRILDGEKLELYDQKEDRRID